MTGPHHHAYVWLGSGDVLVKPGDAHRRPGHPEFRSAQVMPLECADWLLKPASRIEATFDEPKEGADWYAGQLAQYADVFVGSYPGEPSHEETVRALSAGEDRVGGWWVTGGRFLSLNLIACSPHRVRTDYACPGR
ncbi:hypothetical protein SAMN05428945_0955 [Streptomyces sp. 2224.1]|uniref:hypothetical protein n=1 Tax=Streptomyces sp. 2224.1 TaxID=1881020 RepID=UPI00089C2846|nr:hypothetical protein [Streptomyces sp. 2224.1]SEB71610.1 hypothetical protein SAMN05428945_0955 [Streptomyces sp. 2224.1]